MNKFLAGFVGFGAVIAAGALYLQHATVAELRDEITALRADVQQMAKLQKDEAGRRRLDALASPGSQTAAVVTPENGSSDEQRSELSKLRAEIRALAESTQDVARVAQAAQQAAKGESPIPVKLIPVAQLKNAGKATANAAVETLLWAAAGGDVETVASTIVLDPSAQVKAQELFSRLPEATRAQYGSPEKLVALMLAKDASALTGMQILGQRDVTPDVVGVKVRLANEEGKTKEQGLAFQKTADGLRLKVPDDVVDKYARQLGGGK